MNENETGEAGDQRRNRDLPYRSTVEVGLNCKKILEKTCCHLDLSERPPVKTNVKNSQLVK